MPEPSAENLRRSVESLVAHRQAIQVKERTLVGALNRLLRHLGYTVVPLGSAVPAVPSLPRRRGRRRAASVRKASRAKSAPSRKAKARKTAKARQATSASQG
jgi:hypothetical protein